MSADNSVGERAPGGERRESEECRSCHAGSKKNQWPGHAVGTRDRLSAGKRVSAGGGKVNSQLGIFLVTLIFTAGGAWFRFNRLTRDVNGIGRKVNVLEKDDRYARASMALLAIAATEEQKKLVVDCLGGKQQ